MSIGLYVLYLEKWLEHFPFSHFLVLRLEDNVDDLAAHMREVFQFLQVSDPRDWDRILIDKHFNEHRVAREPLLEETESLLRDFYRPFNVLLSKILKDVKFRWDCPVIDGVTVTLRSQQIVESRTETMKAGDKARAILPLNHPQQPFQENNPLPGHHMSKDEINRNQHGPHRSAFEEVPDFNPNAPHYDLATDRRNAERLRRRGPQTELIPKSFSLDGLPMPSEEDVDAIDAKRLIGDLDPRRLGKELCTAAFQMDIAKLKVLLYDIGIPADLVSENDGGRGPFQCLATLFTMGEAHSRSHVFAELKGKETWLTALFDPPLEIKMSSVLSHDIIAHLAKAMVRTARWLERAGVPVDSVDAGGNSALHLAAMGGELELVSLLIGMNAKLDTVNHEQRTALHYAAALGHAEVCGLLMKAGAATDIEDIHGITAMDIISNPGPILREDAKNFIGVDQRPARQIDRKLHPEHYPTDERLGWAAGSGGWGAERLAGFEADMECDVVDQYFADEITGEEIFKNYMAHNAPVLIRGLLKDWEVNELYKVDNLLEDFGDLGVTVSDIPYAQKFGGGEQVEMTLRQYIEEVRAHKMLGGKHPWYVFKGHPIPAASDKPDSLVRYETCPIPDILADAFKRASPPGTTLVQRSPQDRRKMFVNAQWALGGEGTGAPVSHLVDLGLRIKLTTCILF